MGKYRVRVVVEGVEAMSSMYAEAMVTDWLEEAGVGADGLAEDWEIFIVAEDEEMEEE